MAEPLDYEPPQPRWGKSRLTTATTVLFYIVAALFAVLLLAIL